MTTGGETQNLPIEDKATNVIQPPQPPNVIQPPQGSQVFSVRLSAISVPAFMEMILLHFQLGHIAQQTESAYLQYLITKDTEKMRDDIVNRRRALVR